MPLPNSKRAAEIEYLLPGLYWQLAKFVKTLKNRFFYLKNFKAHISPWLIENLNFYILKKESSKQFHFLEIGQHFF